MQCLYVLLLYLSAMINIVKTVVFEWFHFFHLFSNLESRGWDLGHILVSFGDLGGTFNEF